MKKYFIIADRNNRSIPCTDTVYYKWLISKSKTDIHAVNTKIEYLKENGFTIGKDSLNDLDLETLKYIEQAYFQNEIKSKVVINILKD